jgi:hypothetical protein
VNGALVKRETMIRRLFEEGADVDLCHLGERRLKGCNGSMMDALRMAPVLPGGFCGDRPESEGICGAFGRLSVQAAGFSRSGLTSDCPQAKAGKTLPGGVPYSTAYMPMRTREGQRKAARRQLLSASRPGGFVFAQVGARRLRLGPQDLRSHSEDTPRPAGALYVLDAAVL